MKNRSPRFPFIPLEEAVDLLRKLDAFHSAPDQLLRRPDMLKALDYASFHGAAVKTIAALRAYDLLEKKDDGVVISAIGRGILESETAEEKRRFLQRAALSPLAFRMIWRRARHCTNEEIEATLLERGFTESGAERASDIYRENDQFAALHSIEIEPELRERDRGSARRTQKRRKRRDDRTIRDRPLINPESLSMPLSTGRAVIPKGISEEEFDTLMQTLRAWKKQLVTPA